MIIALFGKAGAKKYFGLKRPVQNGKPRRLPAPHLHPMIQTVEIASAIIKQL